MESEVTDRIKSAILVIVTLSIIISGFVTLWLLKKSKTNADDVTGPIATSVFTSGIVIGFGYILVFLIQWFHQMKHPTIFHLFLYLVGVGSFINYISVAILSILKLFAVLKPFLYKRFVTMSFIKNITICIWGNVVCIIIPAMTYFSSPVYNPIMRTIMINTKVTAGNYVLTVSKVVYYTSTVMITASSILFLAAVAQHTIKTRRQVEPQAEAIHQQRQTVLSAIWSYKGVLILAVTRLALNLSYYIVWEKHLRLKPYAFYGMWIVLTTFLWDAVGYVLLSSKLRKLALKSIKCNKDQNTKVMSLNIIQTKGNNT